MRDIARELLLIDSGGPTLVNDKSLVEIYLDKGGCPKNPKTKVYIFSKLFFDQFLKHRVHGFMSEITLTTALFGFTLLFICTRLCI